MLPSSSPKLRDSENSKSCFIASLDSGLHPGAISGDNGETDPDTDTGHQGQQRSSRPSGYQGGHALIKY